MTSTGISFNPTENVYVVPTADDLPDELSQFVLYNCLYDPGSGIGLYYSADGVNLTVLATGGAAGVTSFAGRTGVVSPVQADYDSFFLTPAEGNAAYAPLGSGVTSFNSRTGAVAPAVGDYSAFYMPAGGISSFNSRVGAVSPLQADYDSFFLTQTEADARYATSALDDTINSLWTLQSSSARLRWLETGAATDEGLWQFRAENDVFQLECLNDLGSVASTVFTVSRTADTPDLITSQVPIGAPNFPQTVIKPSDTARDTNASSNDPDLAGITLVAGEFYEFEILAYATCAFTLPGMVLGLNFSNAFQQAFQVVHRNNSSDAGNDALYTTTLLGNQFIDLHTSGVNIARYKGVFQANATTGGTVAVIWGQNVNRPGEDTVLKAGSYFKVTRVYQ